MKKFKFTKSVALLKSAVPGKQSLVTSSYIRPCRDAICVPAADYRIFNLETQLPVCKGTRLQS